MTATCPITSSFPRWRFSGRSEPLAWGGIGTIGTTTLQGSTTVPGVKKVTLTQNLNETIQVAELQAFEVVTGTNVAQQSNGGVATATSVGYGGAATRANDGNTSGSWGNASIWHSDEWDKPGATLTIALANPTTLQNLKFYGRTDCCQTRQNDFTINLLDASNSVLLTKQVIGMGSAPGATGTIDMSGAPTGEDAAALLSGVDYEFEVDALTSAYDMLSVAGAGAGLPTALYLNGANLVVTTVAGTIAENTVLDLLDADKIYGQFAGISLPGDRLSWDLSQLYTTGQITAVPEPATMALLGLAAAGLGGYIRRRRTA